MKIALAQLNSTDSISNNFEQIKNLINEAAFQDTRLIIFPENSLYMRIKEGEPLPVMNWQTPEIQSLKKLAYDKKINIHLTLPFQETNREKLVNASLLFYSSSEFEPKVIYRKVHLFDIELDGQKPIRESDVFEHGPEPTIFEIEDIRFGSSICYDIRFSELYSSYGRQDVDCIIVPAAFLVKTGQAHWEVLLRARAIESQAYVLAPAQSGTHYSQKESQVSRETYGHTMIVGPWGDILAEKKSDIGLIYIKLDKKNIAQIRRQIPMKSHRRL